MSGVFKTMCIIDITYYPFDDQRCELTFGSWSYNIGKVCKVVVPCCYEIISARNDIFLCEIVLQ